MEEKTELHPVVELFLRRAESHPEEITGGKWGWVLAEINKNGSPQERAAVEPVVKKIKLDHVHKAMMKELLNPEPEQLNLFNAGANQSLTQIQAQVLAGAQAQAVARVQESLTKNIPYKKLGKL